MSDDLSLGDLLLAHAIRKTAQVLVPVAADLRREARDERGGVAHLAAFLRSDKPLHQADRTLLADLLEGIVSRPAGRRTNTEVKSRRGAIERDYRAIRQHGGTRGKAWTYLAAREMEQHGADAFQHFGFKPQAGDVDDLAAQFGEWNRRSRKRK